MALAPWTKNSAPVMSAAGAPFVCDTCPCGGDLTCQCVMHYYAIWCMEYWDWEYHPGRYLTVAQVQECIPGSTLVAVTTNIFRILNDPGDGCVRTGGGIAEGWSGWCQGGTCGYSASGPGCPHCPPLNGSICLMDLFTGPPGCENCADAPPLDMSDCTRPVAMEALPADPTILPGCM